MSEILPGLPLSQVIPLELIPIDRLSASEDLTELLDRILVTNLEAETFDDAALGGRCRVDLTFDPEAVLELPGLDGFSVVFGGAENPVVTFGGEVTSTSLKFMLKGSLGIRFPRDWLRPVVKQDGKWVDDPIRKYTEISVSAGVIIDHDWIVTFDATNEFSLGPSMIADTGCVIEGSIAIDLSESQSLPETLAIGLGETWRGVVFKDLSFHLPAGISETLGVDNLILKNFAIGSGGINGEVASKWDEQNPIKTTFFGIEFWLSKIALEFRQNALIGSEIKGKLRLPFFDEFVDIDIAFDLAGNILLALSDLGKPIVTDLFTVSLESFGFERRGDDYLIHIGCQIELSIEGIQIPKFKVKDLMIDSHGNVSIDGGWLNLPKQLSFDFYGFQMEITKVGFGREDDGTKWIGFSGGIKLADSLPIGASVEGLRICWTPDGDVDVTFNGIGVEFSVPEVLRFSGAVSYVGEAEKPYFSGAVKLSLISLGLTADAAIIVGRNEEVPSYSYLYLLLDTQLPAGIPLLSSGLALYGIGGLFASNMEPNKTAEEEWYDGWYKRSPSGVTAPQKWTDRRDAMAVGAGVVIGTASDNGYAFACRTILVAIIPGPIILLEGRAQILSKRAKLTGASDPPFKALVVIDGRAGSFLFNVEAAYRKPQGSGAVIDMRAGAEGFFAGADDWHFYLGEKDPREKRVRASIIKLFEANAFFMLDPTKVEMGACLGYSKTWKFGPVKAGLEAWIEGGALLSWEPVQFQGLLWLHGAMDVKVFGFGFGLSADAKMEVQTPTPYLVLVTLGVKIDLPWFLPDIDLDIELKWEEKVKVPVPLPLKDVAVGHLKVTDTWVAETDKWPDYDIDDDGFQDASPTSHDEETARNLSPIVPMDARPVLSFSRNMDDLMMFDGFPGTPISETVGERDFRYELVAIKLEKYPQRGNPGWRPVATAGYITDVLDNGDGTSTLKTQNYLSGSVDQFVGGSLEIIRVDADNVAQVLEFPVLSHTGGNAFSITVKNSDVLPTEGAFGLCAANQKPLYGHWQAAGDQGPVSTKLYLWSKSPFDYLRAATRNWVDWFVDQSEIYPCQPAQDPQEICFDFDSFPVGSVFPSVAILGALTLFSRLELKIVSHPSPLSGTQHALYLSKEHEVRIMFPQLVTEVTLYADGEDEEQVSITGYYLDEPIDSDKGVGKLQVKGQSIDSVRVFASKSWVLKICYVTLGDPGARLEWEKHNQRVRQEVERWYGEGHVFEPYMWYRIEIKTRVKSAPAGTQPADEKGWNTETEFLECSYFQTQGPPGLVALEPHKVSDQEEGQREVQHQLTDLSLYVAPPGRTIPGEDQRPRTGEPPRPVYRGYDVGVAFNENYVELMYRLAGRDLGLYVYDNNQRPVRDVRGRLLAVPNYWGKMPDLKLTWDDQLWIYTIDRSTCAVINTQTIQRSDSLSAGSSQMVLRPETLHEARLVPLLLRDDFRTGELSTWEIHADGDQGGDPRWQVMSETVEGRTNQYLIQTSGHYGEGSHAADKPGTCLTRGDVGWTDYRLSVTLRSMAEGGIGIVFRYRDKDNHYCFSMDSKESFRRLIKKVAGEVVVLAEDKVPFELHQDYQVVVETVRGDIRVYLDGALLFEVGDTALPEGRIGLYSWANTGARFDDVRLDDFSANAVIGYRFYFVTSRYVDFFHHIHSFEDTLWDLDLETPLSEGQMARLIAHATEALAMGMAFPPLENQEFCKLLNLGQLQGAREVELSLLRSGSKPLGLLLRSPEPLRWERMDMPVIQHADRFLPKSAAPGIDKLTRVGFSPEIRPIDFDSSLEHVELLLRDDLTLSGYTIQHLRHPGSIEPVVKEVSLFSDDFASSISRWTVIDEGGTMDGPSNWTVDGGKLIQTSSIHGDGFHLAEKPGTCLIAGNPRWTDYRVIARLRSSEQGDIGVLFRYRDENNFYRFSVDGKFQHRRLIKKVEGTVVLLWEDTDLLERARTATISLDLFGNRLQGSIDGLPLFEVADSDLSAGMIGLYCWDNPGAEFFKAAVKAIPEKSNLLFGDCFESGIGAHWTRVDEGTLDAPSSWTAAGGILKQTSNIHGQSTDQAGTLLLTGDTAWTDYLFSVRLQSDTDGALGVVFRYLDSDNYYRFSMDRGQARRQLVRKAEGSLTVLWEDSVPYEKGCEYVLAVEVVGDRLRASLQGVPVFDVTDNGPPRSNRGKIGLYCCRNSASCFADIRVSRSGVVERVLLTGDFRAGLSAWTVIDEGTLSQGASWHASGGMLIHSSEAHGGSLDPSAPDKPGTYVVRGEAGWTDYRLSVRVQSDTGFGIGVMARYSDTKNYYRFSMDSRLGYRRLVKKVEGVVTVLAEDGVRYEPGRDYEMALEVNADRIRVLLDGAQVFQASDNAIKAGQVGLYCWGNSNALFANLRITTESWVDELLIDEEFSSLARWSVVELLHLPTMYPSWCLKDGILEHTNLHSGTAVVTGASQWAGYRFYTRLRTRGHGTIGVTFGYQSAQNAYFFGMNSQGSKLWRVKGGTVERLWQGTKTFTPGSWHDLMVDLSGPEIIITLDKKEVLTLRSLEIMGKVGLCAWKDDSAQFDRALVSTRKLVTALIFSDDFSAGMGDWEVVDEGSPSPAASWSVEDRVLSQTSVAHGGSLDPAAADKPGTYVISGDPEWMGYRFVARLASEGQHDIGVMFRYLDRDNYYRFSMNRCFSYRRLIKKVGGVATLLWEDRTSYEIGRDYLVTVDAFGDRIRVYVDGVKLCDQLDTSLPRGRVGLYCWANPGAKFTEPTVLAPQFVDYYRFQDETPLPAGTVIRIHAGAPHQVGAEASFQHRSLLPPSEWGPVHMNPAGEVFRIMDPFGRETHCRPFLPIETYHSSPLGLLRSQDGTLAYIFVPDNENVLGKVTKGHYRLNFTFHRQRDGLEPVLRRAGSSAPEQAAIEFVVSS